MDEAHGRTKSQVPHRVVDAVSPTPQENEVSEGRADSVTHCDLVTGIPVRRETGNSMDTPRLRSVQTARNGVETRMRSEPVISRRGE